MGQKQPRTIGELDGTHGRGGRSRPTVARGQRRRLVAGLALPGGWQGSLPQSPWRAHPRARPPGIPLALGLLPEFPQPKA